ncbi:Translin [Vitis vinifera]|uniref:Translin n=1 Tax=Vitis vinifera TaxID=29760 RepID=A0A438H6P6_VITVI|nr:Translin [Vitis vinifera]
MKAVFRNVFSAVSRSLNPNPHSSIFLPTLRTFSSIILPPSPFPFRNNAFRLLSATSHSSSMAEDGTSSSVEKQFESFRCQLEESGGLRERVRAIAMEIESATRLMHANLLLVHQSRSVPEVLEKASSQIAVLKKLYNQLGVVLQECPGQYYRYHGEWRSETQTAVSLLTFMHWLETGIFLCILKPSRNLAVSLSTMLHFACHHKLSLGMNASDFGLDIEDYLIGVCFMSNELPRYVVNQVTAGDYDCPRKVLKFLTDLHAAFRMLNLRNDFLRKKFDGMKYDLRRVEEVYYDVKIRGLADKAEEVSYDIKIGARMIMGILQEMKEPINNRRVGKW